MQQQAVEAYENDDASTSADKIRLKVQCFALVVVVVV